MLNEVKQKLRANFSASYSKPEMGMRWDCRGVLGVDDFKIIEVNEDNTVKIIEDGYPRGPRIKDVEWPAYLDTIRGQLPLHSSLKYLGITPVSAKVIENAQSWQEMMGQPRPLDF